MSLDNQEFDGSHNRELPHFSDPSGVSTFAVLTILFWFKILYPCDLYALSYVYYVSPLHGLSPLRPASPCRTVRSTLPTWTG